MPRIKGIPGPYRFFFFSADCTEPPHIHVARDENEAKFWLDSLTPIPSRGFSHRELNRIRTFIFEHRFKILEVSNGHCF